MRPALIFKFLIMIFLLSSFSVTFANSINKNLKSSYAKAFNKCKSIVVDRIRQEEDMPPNYYGIAFYKPNFIMPYYYTGSPYDSVYKNYTPLDEPLNKNEFKFQFSVKAPLLQNILNYPASLYAAYTQLSYWQLYNKTSFIRENDYEPEFFLSTKVRWNVFKGWNINLLNVGVVHQSNGFGTDLQRSWNRIYVDAIASSGNWIISLKPWYAATKNGNNSDIEQYLGYGRILLSYKCNNHVVSLQARSLFVQSSKRATGELSWSFPITKYIKGYVQGFTGYGQSLIEYNHRTNSVGFGFALSDWA
ncbi:phospholipase A [Gammaproteobacteria bacterium]|nr:phospholipase A [Gammaproteobacteria bacterium]